MKTNWIIRMITSIPVDVSRVIYGERSRKNLLTFPWDQIRKIFSLKHVIKKYNIWWKTLIIRICLSLNDTSTLLHFLWISSKAIIEVCTWTLLLHQQLLLDLTNICSHTSLAHTLLFSMLMILSWININARERCKEAI